jgi:hypothetical protein
MKLKTIWVIGLALMLLAPAICSGQVLNVPDSLDDRVLSAYGDTSVHGVCLGAILSGPATLEVTEVVTERQPSACRGFRGAIFFVRDTSVTFGNLMQLSETALGNVPWLWLACTGRRTGTRTAGAVPVCRMRDLSPQEPGT